jgi:hypothetical protein
VWVVFMLFSVVEAVRCCSCLPRFCWLSTMAVCHRISVLGLHLYFIANNSELSAAVVLCG